MIWLLLLIIFTVGARSECPSVEDGKWATDACSRLICDDDFIPTTHGTCVGVADFTCQSLQHTGGGNKKTQSIIMDHYQENDNGILDEIEVERMKMVRLILNVNYSSTLKQASHAQREGLSQLILMDLSRATGTDAQVFTVCSLTSIDERKYRSVETMQHRSLPSVFLPSVPSVSSLFSFSFFSHSQDTPSTTQTHTRMSKETHVESAERRRSIRTQMQREDCVSNSAVAVYVAINHPRRERIFHDLRLQQRTPSSVLRKGRVTRLLDAEEDAVEQACRSSKGDENNGLLYTTQDGENNSPAAEYGKSCIPSTSDDDVETTILIAVLGLTLVCCFCSLCYVSYRYRRCPCSCADEEDVYGGDGIFIEEEPLCCGSYDEETDTYDDSCCSGECCITLTEYMYGKGPNNAVGRLDDDENEGNFMARGKASNVAYYSSQKTYIDDDEENANTVSAFHRAHTHTTNNENQVNCRISTTDGGNQSATATRNNTVTVSMTMATLNLEAGSSSNDSEEDADRRSEAVTELADEPTQEMRTSRDIEVSSMNNEDSDASSNDRTTSAHPADETRRSGGENVPTHEEVPEKHKDVITDKSSGIKGRRRISDGGTSMQTQDKGDKFPTRAIPLRSQRTSISLLPDLGKSHRISAVLQAPQSYNSLTSPSASFNPMSNPNPNPLAAASPTSSLSSAVTPIMLGRTSGKRVLAPLRNTKPRKSRSKIKNTDSNRTNIKSSIAKACTDTHLAASSLVSARNISTGAGGQQEDSAGHTVGSACDRRNAEVRIENTTAMPEYVTNEDSNTAADNERAHTENERWPVREEKKATENETETDQDRESCEISQNVFVSDEERNGSADEFNVCGGNNDPERSENRQDIYYDIDENKGNVNGADEKDASEQTTDEAGNRKAVDKTALSLDHPTIESSTKKGSTGKGHRRGTSYDTHIDAILNDSDESVDSDDSVSLSISLNQHSDSEDDASDNEPLTGLKDIDINTEDECSRSEFESGGENSRRRGRRSRRQRKKRGRCSAPSDIDVEESRDIGSFLPSRPAGPYPLNNTTNIPVSDMQSHTARTNATSLSGLMDDLNDTLIYENSIDGDDHNNVASGNVDEDGGDRYVEMGRSNEPFSRQRNAGSRTDRSSYSVVSAVSMGSRMSNETSYTNTTPGPVPSLPSRSPSEPTSLDPHQPPPNPHSLKNGRSATSSLLATSSSLRIHSDNKSIINRSGFISLSIETGSHRSCGKLTAGTVPPASAISASSVDQTDDVRIFGNNYARYHSRSKSHVTPLSGVGSSSHDHPEVKADTLSSNSIHGNVYRVHSNNNHDAIEGKGRNRVKQRRRRRRADRTNAGHRRRPRDSARTVTARKRDRGEDDKSSDSSEVDTLSDSSQNHDYSDSDGDLSSSTGADSDSFDDSNEEIDTNHLRGLSSRTHTPSALSVPPTPPALPAMPSSSSVSAAAASSNPYSPLPPAFSFTPNTGSSTTNPLTSPTNNGVPPMPPPLPSRTGKHHQ